MDLRINKILKPLLGLILVISFQQPSFSQNDNLNIMERLIEQEKLKLKNAAFGLCLHELFQCESLEDDFTVASYLDFSSYTYIEFIV